MCNQKLIAAAHKYLGRPWASHGFDCWECVRAVYFDAFGIILDQFQIDTPGDHQETMRAIAAEKDKGKWLPIEYPKDGCIVAMGKREWPHHIGVYLDAEGGKIIHCSDPMGCVIDSVGILRRSGWGFLRFYELAKL